MFPLLRRLLALALPCLLLSPLAARAVSPLGVDPILPPPLEPRACADLSRALRAAAQETDDPELDQALATILDKGFLPRIVVTWEASHGPPEAGVPPVEWWRDDVDPCADLARIRSRARSYLDDVYPGSPLSGGRTYRSNEDPPSVWRTNWYVDWAFVIVYVDTDTWRAWED